MKVVRRKPKRRRALVPAWVWVVSAVLFLLLITGGVNPIG